MNHLGTMLIFIGCLMALISAIYICLTDEKTDTKASEYEELFILAWIDSFIRGFAKGISTLVQRRPSSTSYLAILFSAGLGVAGLGLWLMKG